MNYNQFRDHTPTRTCKKKYQRYGSYKEYLRNDFKQRCGYCNSIDSLSTYSAVFQIDHFVPKKKFEQFFDVDDYSNLVYACPTCNRYKSDKWISTDPTVSIQNKKGFVDPCSEQYSEMFLRDDTGKIVAKDDLSAYMHNELRFYMRRHEVLYKLEKLDFITKRFKARFEENKLSSDDKSKLISIFYKLQEYSEYLNKKDHD